MAKKSLEKLLGLMKQYDRETVSPKLEQFRNSEFKINGAYGGRGAGAKSWSFDSLMVQRAHREKLRIACFREIQESLKESSYASIRNQVDRLGYTGWSFQTEKILSPAGSKIIFRGLKDIRAAQQVKSYEGFDIFRIEEASAISMDSWRMILYTLRSKGCQFWITWNPENDIDPVWELFVMSNRPDAKIVFCEPGEIDNPWWHDTELPIESDLLKKSNPDEWAHYFGGEPRAQGSNCIMSRVLINQAMIRDIANPIGGYAVGCDVSDYGDDKTTIYLRKGLKVVKKERFNIPASEEMPGKMIALRIKNMIKGDVSIPIYLDATGIGASARDFCRQLKLKVIPIHFGAKAHKSNLYANLATELWFDFKENFLDKCDLINDNNLRQELSGRQYGYDHENRYIIEPKDKFKERIGRSPDDADGLLLCFYNPALMVNETAAKEMAERYRR